MKVYTLEYFEDVEGFFGTFQTHEALDGVFATRERAEEFGTIAYGPGDFVVKEWELRG